jgi:hypothetical protein
MFYCGVFALDRGYGHSRRGCRCERMVQLVRGRGEWKDESPKGDNTGDREALAVT